MDSASVFDRLEQPPAPLERLHQQSLKNRDYALAVLAQLPDEDPLREELTELMRELEHTYETEDAVAHYRLDKQLFLHFMMKLNFTVQANRS